MRGFILLIVLSTAMASSFVIGMHFHSFKDSLQPLIGTIASVCASLATIITACIAWIALNTWKLQFNYAERFKSLVDLENKSKDYIKAFKNYYIAEYHRQERSIDNTPKGAPSDNKHELFFNRYKDLHNDVLVALSYSCNFLSNSEQKKLRDTHRATLAVFDEARIQANKDYREKFKGEETLPYTCDKFEVQYKQFIDCIKKLRK